MLAMTISPFCLGSNTLILCPNILCSSSSLTSHRLATTLLLRSNIALNLALADVEKEAFDDGLMTSSSKAESKPIRCKPFEWCTSPQPQSEDAGDVEAEV
jgi:hypothetical protein